MILWPRRHPQHRSSSAPSYLQYHTLCCMFERPKKAEQARSISIFLLFYVFAYILLLLLLWSTQCRHHISTSSCIVPTTITRTCSIIQRQRRRCLWLLLLSYLPGLYPVKCVVSHILDDLFGISNGTIQRRSTFFPYHIFHNILYGLSLVVH